jgi:hypothetical protein
MENDDWRGQSSRDRFFGSSLMSSRFAVWHWSLGVHDEPKDDCEHREPDSVPVRNPL